MNEGGRVSSLDGRPRPSGFFWRFGHRLRLNLDDLSRTMDLFTFRFSPMPGTDAAGCDRPTSSVVAIVRAIRSLQTETGVFGSGSRTEFTPLTTHVKTVLMTEFSSVNPCTVEG